jgi:hypothetical protein
MTRCSIVPVVYNCSESFINPIAKPHLPIFPYSRHTFGICPSVYTILEISEGQPPGAAVIVDAQYRTISPCERLPGASAYRARLAMNYDELNDIIYLSCNGYLFLEQLPISRTSLILQSQADSNLRQIASSLSSWRLCPPAWFLFEVPRSDLLIISSVSNLLLLRHR